MALPTPVDTNEEISTAAGGNTAANNLGVHLSNIKISPNASTPSPAMFANLMANIPPDVHARIEAFQRRNKSVPVGAATSAGPGPGPGPGPTGNNGNLNVSPKSNFSMGSNVPNLESMKAFTEETSNMPMDHFRVQPSGNSATYKTTIPNYSQFHQDRNTTTSSKEQERTKGVNTEKSQTATESPIKFSGPIYGKVIPSAGTPSPHLSLSSGRGMKLNQSDSSVPKLPAGSLMGMPTAAAPPSVISATAPAPSIRPNKPAGLKLNLGSNNLFSNHSKYVDVKKGSLNFAGKASLHSKGIDFSSGSKFRISLDELEPLGELGRGNYGTVTKVLHKPTNVLMAMKEIRLELEETKFSQIIMELDILHKCVSPYIVDFYGAFFAEGAVYVCMEYMDGGSLDKIYDGGVDEPFLAVITNSVIHGLKQLKEEHNIIHRDVKPTNILVSTNGTVKLCDFGVSGNLVASIARTNIGCQSYMAPERIISKNPNDAITYTVQSDIWSLGLSILEVAKGSYPYPPETYSNIFSQLSAIVDGKPPSLPADRFSEEARSFIQDCLNKIPESRPTYSKLLKHPWLSKYKNKDVDLGEFVRKALEKKAALESPVDEEQTTKSIPALHKGNLGTEGVL